MRYGPSGELATAWTMTLFVSQLLMPQEFSSSENHACHWPWPSKTAVPPQLDVLPRTSYAVLRSEGAKSSVLQSRPSQPLSQTHVPLAASQIPFSEQSRSLLQPGSVATSSDF